MTTRRPNLKKFSEQDSTLPKVEIFRAGTHRGKTYTTRDLDAIVDAFEDYSSGDGSVPLRVPAVLGHDEEAEQELLKQTGLPAAGWVENIWREGDTLCATIADVAPEVMRLIAGKRYRRVSAEVYDQHPPGLPTAGAPQKMLRRVAFLGGEIPQVKTLSDIPIPYSEGPNRTVRVVDGATQLRTVRTVANPGAGTFMVFSETVPLMAKPKRKKPVQQPTDEVYVLPSGQVTGNVQEAVAAERRDKNGKRANDHAEPTQPQEPKTIKPVGAVEPASAPPQVAPAPTPAAANKRLKIGYRSREKAQAPPHLRNDLQHRGEDDGKPLGLNYAEDEGTPADEEQQQNPAGRRHDSDEAGRRVDAGLEEMRRTSNRLRRWRRRNFGNKNEPGPEGFAEGDMPMDKEQLLAKLQGLGMDTAALENCDEPALAEMIRVLSGSQDDQDDAEDEMPPDDMEPAPDEEPMPDDEPVADDMPPEDEPVADEPPAAPPETVDMPPDEDDEDPEERAAFHADMYRKYMERCSEGKGRTPAEESAVRFGSLKTGRGTDVSRQSPRDSQPRLNPQKTKKENEDEGAGVPPDEDEDPQKMAAYHQEMYRKYMEKCGEPTQPQGQRPGDGVEHEIGHMRDDTAGSSARVRFARQNAARVNRESLERAFPNVPKDAIPKYSEQQADHRLKAINDRIARAEQLARQREAAERKATVTSRLNALVVAGKVLPAERDAGLDDALLAIPVSAVVKFSENGKVYEEPVLDRLLDALEARPVLMRFSERIPAAPAPKPGSEDAEVAKLEAHYEQFSEAYERANLTKDDMIAGYKAERKIHPKRTADEYINR